jgi:dihydrofolate synthase/folylpolyglutamate synthase
MSYEGTINYLYNLQKYGIKFGLDNISRLMSALDNPHKSFLSIHVAGTNGKGSTSAIIASILKTAGLKVGLFTSPHIVSFTERVRVNGEEITEEEVVSLTEEIRDIIDRSQESNPPLPPFTKGGRGGIKQTAINNQHAFKPTFFEFVTAMALLYFKRRNIDVAVIEVGMGGRLDATNIITPEVSVITKISYDHREFLGNTLREIAHEKAGIIKGGIPVVASYQEPEAMEVIEEKIIEKDTVLYVYGRDFSSVLKRENLLGIYFDYFSYHDSRFTIHDLYLPLIGGHQMENASVAIKTIEIISNKINSKFLPSPPLPIEGEESQGATVEGGEHTPTPLSRGDLPSPLAGEGKGEGDKKPLNPNWSHFIRDGLKNVRWPGRLEIIKDDPPVLIDGAHNPAAAIALSNALEKNFLRRYKRIILILGIMGDKDIKGIMKPLLPLASEIILTSPDYERAAPPARLATMAASLGFPDVRIAPTVRDAIELAIKDSYKLQVTSYKLNNNKNSKLNSSLLTPHSSLIVITGSFYTIGEAEEVVGHKGVLTRLRE